MFKFKEGQFWETKQGKKVLICKIAPNGCIQVFSDSSLITLHPDGRYYVNAEHEFDLFRPWVEPKQIKGWVNIYPDCVYFHDTEKLAKTNVGRDVLHTAVPFVWTEGKGFSNE